MTDSKSNPVVRLATVWYKVTGEKLVEVIGVSNENTSSGHYKRRNEKPLEPGEVRP